MGALRHLLIVVVIGVVFRWLWKSSLNEHASVEAVRTVFPPTRAVRSLAVLFGVAFTCLFLWSWFAVRKPDEWWVPYLFLGFVALSLCIYPPVLSIEVDGIGSRSWLGREKKIRWEDVTSLRYNTATSNSPCVLTMVARSLTLASRPNLACFRTRFRSAPACP